MEDQGRWKDTVHWVIDGILVAILCIVVVDSATVTGISIQNNQDPVKGSDVTLVCSVSGFETGLVYVYKTDSSTRPDALVSSLGYCTATQCYARDSNKYTLSSNVSDVSLSIPSLTRNIDQKWWHCISSSDSSKQVILLTVYTPPSSVSYNNVSLQNKDLSTGHVILSCQTDCSYTQPSLEWFYTEVNTSRLPYFSNGTVAITEGGCTDSERIYISTLTLPRYTTFTGNADKTVKFECGIMSFPGLPSPLYTQLSPDITFAVRITSVSLIDGHRTPTSTINVTNGVNKQLTCTTSVSRPPATIVWYIGNTERQRSRNTTFDYTPINSDHDKQIYCRAFNIQPENQSVSSTTHTLYVNIPVSAVTLTDDFVEPVSTVSSTVGVAKTLTCTPGTSRPSPTIAWYIGDVHKQSSPNTTYTFTPTNADHDKHVYCTATNSDLPAVVSAKLKLYVRVEARTPTLLNKTTHSLVLLAGDEVRFTCRTTPTRPAANVLWKNGDELMTSVTQTTIETPDGLQSVISHVTFTPGQSDNQHTIRCETGIPTQVNVTVDQQQISVLWPPFRPAIPTSSFPWLEGQTNRTLKCISNNTGNPTATVRWTSQSGVQQGNTTLVFPVLKPMHDGEKVICQLHNEYTQIKNQVIESNVISLNIQYKPLVIVRVNNQDTNSITVSEGQSLQAVCSAVGNPTSDVKWIDTTSPILYFTDIGRLDAKQYICEARATSTAYPTYNFVTQTSLGIIVNYAPDVTVTTSTQQFTENQPLQIYCSAAGKPDSYSYTGLTQTVRGRAIQNPYTAVPGTVLNSSLDIRSLKLEDTGTYTCFVNNGITNKSGELIQSKSTLVSVKVSPKVLTTRDIFAGSLDESISINISYYSLPADTTLTLIKGSTVLVSDGNKFVHGTIPALVTTAFYDTEVTLDGNIATLQINNLTEYDFTTYTLILQNSVGGLSWNFMIRPKGVPLIPYALRVSATSGGLSISWRNSFNGGYEQYIMIETSLAGTDEWTLQLSVEESNNAFRQPDGSYRANITDLVPGTYRARIVAANALGKSDAVVFSATLTVEDSEDTSPRTSVPVTAIATGIASSVILVAVVAVVLVILKKPCRNNSRTLTNNVDIRNTECEIHDRTSHQYEDISFSGTPGVTEHQCENVRNMYEDLQSQTMDPGNYVDLHRTTEQGCYEIARKPCEPIRPEMKQETDYIMMN